LPEYTVLALQKLTRVLLRKQSLAFGAVNALPALLILVDPVIEFVIL
jgi:hypothetical protein